MGWFFSDDNEEIETLKQELFCTRAEVNALKKDKEQLSSEIDRFRSLYDRREFELQAYGLRCEMYDRVMKGLNININIAGKTK